MALDRTTLLTRIDALWTLANTVEPSQIHAALQGTLTLVRLLYGTGSAQEDSLNSALKRTQAVSAGPVFTVPTYLAPSVRGTLLALRGDIEAGLVGDLKRKAVGEVMADMLTLAKETLTADTKNVAAVLTAASFEDVIRRLGSTFVGIHDRRKLSEVLIALKEGKILEGAQFGIAQSYLQFRNDAVHADWDKVDSSAVSSCIGFVEQLLMKHFS
jgi:hypothetical protein